MNLFLFLPLFLSLTLFHVINILSSCCSLQPTHTDWNDDDDDDDKLLLALLLVLGADEAVNDDEK